MFINFDVVNFYGEFLFVDFVEIKHINPQVFFNKLSVHLRPLSTYGTKEVNAIMCQYWSCEIYNIVLVNLWPSPRYHCFISQTLYLYDHSFVMIFDGQVLVCHLSASTGSQIIISLELLSHFISPYRIMTSTNINADQLLITHQRIEKTQIIMSGENVPCLLMSLFALLLYPNTPQTFGLFLSPWCGAQWEGQRKQTWIRSQQLIDRY